MGQLCASGSAPSVRLDVRRPVELPHVHPVQVSLRHPPSPLGCMTRCAMTGAILPAGRCENGHVPRVIACPCAPQKLSCVRWGQPGAHDGSLGPRALPAPRRWAATHVLRLPARLGPRQYLPAHARTRHRPCAPYPTGPWRRVRPPQPVVACLLLAHAWPACGHDLVRRCWRARPASPPGPGLDAMRATAAPRTTRHSLGVMFSWVGVHAHQSPGAWRQ
jgi:hypothetical protein